MTLDKDFGELAIVAGQPHAGIVRLVGLRAVDQARACLEVIGRFGRDLARGALVTVEPGRVRVRIPDEDTP